MKPKVLVIAGPTASGKTKLSVELAKRLNGEIISADSMQIYKNMNIGTAKPTMEEMSGIPHHLIDFLEVGEYFSVAQYKKMAMSCIAEILDKGKVPIIVGGTGLYINSITEEINYDESVGSFEIRQELKDIADNRGNEVLFEELKKIDLEAYNKLHLNDTKRIIRALEVYKSTGITITEHKRRSKEIEKKYDYRIVGLLIERSKLYERINQRVDLMMEAGLEKEAKQVLEIINERTGGTSFQAIGYKEFAKYFSGEMELNEVTDIIKQESRRYAKRQITWFKQTKGLKWIDAERDFDEIANEVIEYYKRELSCYL